MSSFISLCVLLSRFNASYLGHTLSRDSVRVWIEGGGPTPPSMSLTLPEAAVTPCRTLGQQQAGARHEGAVAVKDLEFAFQHVDKLVLAVVYMGRRPELRRDGSLKQH